MQRNFSKPIGSITIQFNLFQWQIRIAYAYNNN